MNLRTAHQRRRAECRGNVGCSRSRRASPLQPGHEREHGLCGEIGKITRNLGDAYRLRGTWRVLTIDPDCSTFLICVLALSNPESTLQQVERERQRAGSDLSETLMTLVPSTGLVVHIQTGGLLNILEGSVRC